MSEEPWGLSLNEKLLPEYLQDNGYDTHLIGKWHMGFYRKAYTPTERGFKSHFGYYGPALDYYRHGWAAEVYALVHTHSIHRDYIDLAFSISYFKDKPYGYGHDLRENKSVHYTGNRTYVTDLFTDKAVKLIERHDRNLPLYLQLAHCAPHAGPEDDPLQVPDVGLSQFRYIKDKQRRAYAGISIYEILKYGLRRFHLFMRFSIYTISNGFRPRQKCWESSKSTKN